MWVPDYIQQDTNDKEKALPESIPSRKTPFATNHAQEWRIEDHNQFQSENLTDISSNPYRFSTRVVTSK